jgi:lipopolysaccharide/colanic/teichoic acid biosynthesis glycosyltransferase
MSIVGPSPCVAAQNTIFVERVSFIQQRYRMRPGMTGWAQVNGCCGERWCGPEPLFLGATTRPAARRAWP